MIHVGLPIAVCAVAAEVLRGSHASLELLFEAAGIPGPPPLNTSHATKWKYWLFREVNRPGADGLRMLGNLIGEFMDLPPLGPSAEAEEWARQRDRVLTTLEQFGLSYFPGGRVLPTGVTPSPSVTAPSSDVRTPSSIDEVLTRLITGLPRAMYPLTHRRKGAARLTFDLEWDLQDLLHALLRPWVRDIRPEEFTPSYAGKSNRMDFLLPEHRLVLELKVVRDVAHGRAVGQELTIDSKHYCQHPQCDRLWCVIYDPNHYLSNPDGLVRDLEGRHTGPNGAIDLTVFVVPKVPG